MTLSAFEPDDWLRNAEALRRAARALVRDEASGDDLAQSAWLSALQQPPRHWSRAWFLRVLRNKALDRLRRTDSIGERAAVERTAPSAGDLAERLELHRTLADAVEQLREPYRQVVYLRYFEGRGPSEIARELDLPVKTVKTRLHRALAQLRARLECELGGTGRDWRALVFAACADVPSQALSTPLWAGGIGLMTKKILAVGAVLALACGVAFWGPFGGEPLAPSEAKGAAGAREELVGDSTRDLVGDDPEDEARSALVQEDGPAPAELAAPATGSIVVYVTWSDGAPAGGIGVDVRRYMRGLPFRGLAREVTDGAGRARFDGLHPAEVSVRSDRGVGEGDPAVVLLEAGAEERVDLVIPAGALVSGVVRAADGQPVADAGIWLTTHHEDWQGGRVVGHTDASGRYTLRDVPREQSLGALAAGHAPSKLVDLETLDLAVEPVPIDLTLGAAGGSLRGLVLTPDGQPAAGAWVTAGAAGRSSSWRASGGVVESWSPRAVCCDAEGRFLIAGLVTGELPVRARLAPHPVWSGSAEIRERATADLEIRLSAGFSLSGTVRDAAGDTVEGAVVRGFPRELDESFVQGGQFDWQGAFGYPITRSDDQGRYALVGLAAGRVWAYASPKPDKKYRFDRGSIMRAQTILDGLDGEALAWDPVLEDGPTIRGLVAFKDGTPMKGVFVSARDDSSGKTQSLTTTSDGRFRFLNMRAGATYTLGVQLWDPPEGAEPLEATGVVPDGEEVHLIADFEGPYTGEKGSIRGRVDDRGKRIKVMDRMSVMLEMDGGTTRVGSDKDGASFVFTGCEPQTYTPIVMEGDDVVFVGEPYELGPGEDLDLGALVTEPAGSLRLLIQHAPGAETAEAKAYVRGQARYHSRRADLAGQSEVLLENLTPGEHTITVWGKGVQSTGGSATVVGGAVAEATLELTRAARQRFEVTWPEGAALGKLDATIKNSAGEKSSGFGEINVTFLPRPYKRTVQLPLGAYTIEVTTKTGMSARASFSITSYDEESSVIKLELR